MTPAWLCAHAGLLHNLHMRSAAGRQPLDDALRLAIDEANRLRDSDRVLGALHRASAASSNARAAESRLAELIDQLITGLSRTSS